MLPTVVHTTPWHPHAGHPIALCPVFHDSRVQDLRLTMVMILAYNHGGRV